MRRRALNGKEHGPRFNVCGDLPWQADHMVGVHQAAESVLQCSWKDSAERRHISQRHIYYLTAAFPRTWLRHKATVHTHRGSHLGGRHQTLKEKQKFFPSISNVPAHWDIIEEGAWFGMISLFLREMLENMSSPGVSAAVYGIYKLPCFEVWDGCTSFFVLWCTGHFCEFQK